MIIFDLFEDANKKPQVAEAGEWPDKMSHDDLVNMQKNHQKWSEQDTPSRTDPSATVEDFYHEVVRLGPGLGRDLLYFAAEEGDEPPHIVKAARQLYKKIARKAGLNPEIGSADNNEVFDLMYDWVGKNYSNTGVAETAPLSRDARRERVAPTDRDTVRRELWKYVRSLDQEGSSNRAHAMAHSCPTWGRLYRQFNDDVSQLLSKAPTELLAQALQEIQSKFQDVAEGIFDRFKKTPKKESYSRQDFYQWLDKVQEQLASGEDIDEVIYNLESSLEKIYTDDVVAQLKGQIWDSLDLEMYEQVVTENQYEIHHLDPEGRRKAIYHHGRGYTDDVVRKDTQYHQERNPRDTFRVFKDKQPFDWQGVTESAGRGEYYIWTVHFANPEKNPPRRVRVYSDEFVEELEHIKKFYAKKGLTVVDVDTDVGIRSEPKIKPERYEVDEGEVTKTATGIRHRSTDSYGGTPREPNPLRTLDKSTTNKIDRALGVKFNREKKWGAGLDLDENTPKMSARERLQRAVDREKKQAQLDRTGLAGMDYDQAQRQLRGIQDRTSPKKVNEVSPKYIEQFKKEHGRRATAADQAGDHAKGHEHFKKINQLTKQQFQRGAKKNAATESVTEESDNEAVEQAIIRRIMVGRTDLLLKYGPRKVMQAVEEVADYVGAVDEIGSSDVSGWVAQVERTLGGMSEAASLAQQAAIAINMKKQGKTPKHTDEAKATSTRLDPKCWTGKKIGNPKTKVKGGVRVNNCVPK